LQNNPQEHPLRGVLARNYMILADLLRRTGDEAGAADALREAKLLRPGRRPEKNGSSDLNVPEPKMPTVQ
jgi:hypothetical protein